jgi:predicted nucleic acid-binding protein
VADRWVLDTNVYIRALRERQRLADLKRFRVRARTRLWLSAVVALELRAGAVTTEHVEALEDLLKIYTDRDRVVIPTFDAYLQSGRIIAALATKERLALGDAPRSFVNDVILATSCREAGALLVTDNTRDFITIQRHLKGFRFQAELPS